MKPNLFSIATKELHQDAFIAWLVQWADPKNASYDETLHRLGITFVKALLAKRYPVTDEPLLKVRCGRQWENIDVYVEVETATVKYLIVIEDKTFTKKREGQLERYHLSGERWCKKFGAKLCCVYLKTGSESQKSLNLIKKDGFATFDRKDFIAILDQYPSSGSDILTDFRVRLHQLQMAHDAFETTQLGQWDDACWIGFYQYLEKNLGIIDWNLVNPPSGASFWNAVLNWDYWNGFPVYLQIEQGKLCFKISYIDAEIDTELSKSELRNRWYEIVRKAAQRLNEDAIHRPNRFGVGDYMTTAVVNAADWLGDPKQNIDPVAVISRLRHYKNFLKSLLPKENHTMA